MASLQAFERALAALPLAYPGPGGAVAVLRDGEVLARHAWGWADVDRHIAFTPQTLFRICSISKQFTCAAMLDLFPDPRMLDGDVRALLPLLEEQAPGALDLAHNQSGLRDYWAVAMLSGSPIEARFGEAETAQVIGRTRSLQFAPGTRYSYCNQNFRILGDILAARAGRSYAELVRSRVFDRAGMATAQLCADTSVMPDGTLGYEGSLEGGFRPAVNNIVWTGDAGLGASLDDMIAWERFIDATREDAAGIYQQMSEPVQFRDGALAGYGFGLARVKLLGRAGTGHGGGLRGWRSFRFYLPAERISIVALFNHMADPRAAALDLLATLLEPDARPASPPAATHWNGVFLEPQTGLAVRLATSAENRVTLKFVQGTETLEPGPDGQALGGSTTLRRTDAGIWMDRAGDNQSSLLSPVFGVAEADVVGVFDNAELGASFTCVDAGGTLYGAFSGFLGSGVMQLLVPVAADVWMLPMPRALDHAPPGDWTLAFQRDGAGRVASVRIGCWLARRLLFIRRDAD